MRIIVTCALLLSPLTLVTPAYTTVTATRSATRPLTVRAAATRPQPEDTPTPSPSPTPDPLLEQAEREAKLAEELKKKAVSDKERVEAENEKLKAQVQPLGAPSNITIPTGAVSTDAAGWVESQMLAQEAAKQITLKLSRRLCPLSQSSNGKSAPSLITLIIYSNNDLTSVELYGAIKGQLGVLEEELGHFNELADQAKKASDPKTGDGQFVPKKLNIAGLPAVLAAPGVATGIIKSVAELINLFRTDTTFANNAVTIPEDLVVSYLVQDLDETCGKFKIYYPALYPPNLLDDASKSNLLKTLNRVEKAKNQAAIHIEALDARVKELKKLVGTFEDFEKQSKAKKEKETEYAEKCKNKRTAFCEKLKEDIDELQSAMEKNLETLKTALDKKTADEVKKRIEEIKPWIENVGDLKAKMQALVTATELILTKLNAPDANSKLSAVAQLLRAERLHDLMIDARAYTLRVAIKANGTTKVKKNLFVDAKVRHSAGADLVYQLFDKTGFIAQADGLKCYIEYKSSHDVKNIVTGAKKVLCQSASNTGTQEQIGDDKNGGGKTGRGNNGPR